MYSQPQPKESCVTPVHGTVTQVHTRHSVLHTGVVNVPHEGFNAQRKTAGEKVLQQSSRKDCVAKKFLLFTTQDRFSVPNNSGRPQVPPTPERKNHS